MSARAIRTTPIAEPERGRQLRPTPVPDRTEIAALAYQLWEERGCPIGTPEEDWLRAEEELKAALATAT
jgi:hypothetical protein